MGDARGLVLEAACAAAHAALYPAAALNRRRQGRPRDVYRLADLPPVQRGLLVGDITAAATPILLVHGLIDNRSVFARMERALRRRGFARVIATDIPLFTTSVQTAAGQLRTEVDRIIERTGSPHVHIVAHSLGGLVARYYVQILGGDEQVHTLITLGTPHGGTRLAHLLPRAVRYPLVADLRPGSALLRELDQPAVGCRTRFIAVAGALDNVVRPHEAALRHPDLNAHNLTLPGLGHHALPFSRVVAHSVAAWLGPAHSRPDSPAAALPAATPSTPAPAPAAAGTAGASGAAAAAGAAGAGAARTVGAATDVRAIPAQGGGRAAAGSTRVRSTARRTGSRRSSRAAVPARIPERRTSDEGQPAVTQGQAKRRSGKLSVT